MKIVALWASFVFAGSPVVARICTLACAGPSGNAVAEAPHSHCGESAPSRPDAKRDPCGHGHRGESLLSSPTAAKVTLVAAADFEPVDSRAEMLHEGRRPTTRSIACESPPQRSSPSILRL